MKVKLYENGKQMKATKAEIVEIVGQERFDIMVKESKAAHREDPLEKQSYMIGCNMTVEFCF